MAIIQRRVFYGKVGASDGLVAWAKEMYGMIHEHDNALAFRVLTDHHSGRTDRVVVELEAESLAHIESMLEKLMSDPDGQAKFAAAFGKLGEMLEHAEVEQWMIQ